jgi:hypothetical protein
MDACRSCCGSKCWHVGACNFSRPLGRCLRRTHRLRHRFGLGHGDVPIDTTGADFLGPAVVHCSGEPRHAAPLRVDQHHLHESAARAWKATCGVVPGGSCGRHDLSGSRSGHHLVPRAWPRARLLGGCNHLRLEHRGVLAGHRPRQAAGIRATSSRAEAGPCAVVQGSVCTTRCCLGVFHSVAECLLRLLHGCHRLALPALARANGRLRGRRTGVGVRPDIGGSRDGSWSDALAQAGSWVAFW